MINLERFTNEDFKRFISWIDNEFKSVYIMFILREEWGLKIKSK